MAVGLGSGTTSKLVIDEVGRRVQEGLRIKAIATSIQSHSQAVALGIPMTTFAETPRLDLAIDGADEVQRGTLHLIKGHGGALLREKLVEIIAQRLLIAVDPRKIVDVLGSVFEVPVEVVPFGWESTARRLEDLGFAPKLRVYEGGKDDGKPYITDEGNFIFDCHFGRIEDPRSVAREIREITGVVEHGLFLGMATNVIIAGSAGLVVLTA